MGDMDCLCVWQTGRLNEVVAIESQEIDVSEFWLGS